MGRLFGTDGVRDIANAGLTPELAFVLGRAGASVLTAGARRPRVVIGRDTRISGEMLEAAMVAGITSAGADVVLVGVVPTPGIAYLTRVLEADAGVVISASHNPVEYNGIKFFSKDGFKLPDEVEDEIEARMAGGFQGGDSLPRPQGGGVGRVYHDENAVQRYIDHLVGTVDEDLLAGFHVVLDCANGAASRVAPQVLARLGAKVSAVFACPDGTNINEDCGSTHPDALCRAVVEHGADFGLAYDGDADRVLAADRHGSLVDGDQIMTICGLDLLRRGRLPGKAIAATVYSNMGLMAAFEREGGSVVITKAGDRYVLQAMLEKGLALGGEQSGHIIFLEHNTTGDGILTGLQLLSTVIKSGQDLTDLAAQMERFPQVLVNVRVRSKEGLECNPRIQGEIRRAAEALGREGRLFVRPSGTEPVIRVLGEGRSEAKVRAVVQAVADAIEAELG